MMENNESGFVTCADRISDLQDHLIDLIFERLPVKDAVRTSILSKNWRYKWTTMGTLVFDEHFSKKIAKNGGFGRKEFIRIINQVLFLHKGPIHKFRIHIPNMGIHSFQEIDQWMLFLSRNGVTELALINSNSLYHLPSYVFACLKLTKLELKNCFFKPPPEFEGFLKLEQLHLYNIDFGANLCGSKINLPQLKKLSLRHCTNVYNFNIKATQLQELFICDCPPDALLLQFVDNPCIFFVGIVFDKPVGDFVRIRKLNLARMLSNLARVQHFITDGDFFKKRLLKLLPRAISSLNCLGLLRFQLGDLDHLHGALCLLRNSPNLKSLYITHKQEPRVDVGPASDHLESPNCLDCKLNRLLTVEIHSFEGSRPELLFIKLLLAHSPSLRKFIIKLNGGLDVKRKCDIAKNVMQFPQASTKAKIFFLDSEP